MLAEIFMLRLEAVAAGSQRSGPSLTVRPDHVAGCEGVLTRAAGLPRPATRFSDHAVQKMLGYSKSNL